ncbi:MAG TPA: FlgD immunoglobulin-like domain containing protein [Phycisphaerae bacterium]|nr:FlgD immunoglobulin-like domain containing protein [Phycisphaerae bacterium]HRY68345.1 FlgD immunoglobulin-like domain containing protein [Phycisphaerae bacterium]HSA26772.1 FlgD immunoglobulin-like domain containing protein [Phycisphaerae bacterium]
MNRHTSYLSVLLAAACLVALPAAAYANVYPSGVTVDASALNGTCGTATVTYILNENANGDGTRPGVTIEVLDSSSTAIRTVTIARQAKGKHAWQWDGRKDDGTRAPSGMDKTYSFRVTAADQGHTSWSEIGGHDTAHSFYYPTGVDVNRNPASPHYGKIYVAENNVGDESGLTAFGRNTKNGVYCLSADGAEVAFSNAVDPAGTMTDWTHDTTNYSSPFRLNIGWDDGHVYVASFFDDFAFEFTPDLSSVVQLLAGDYSNQTHYGETDDAAHDIGQWISSLLSIGSKEAGNRELCCLNSNYWASAPNNRGVIKYVLGNQDRATPADVGTRFIYTTPYYGYDFARDKDGNFYITNYRAKAGEAAAVEKYDPTGAKIETFTTPNDQPYVRGVGVCESKGWVAVSKRYQGSVPIYNSTTGAQLYIVAAEGNVQVADVAFDDAGNLYTICNSSEWLRVWSPPDGPNHKDLTSASFVLDKPGAGGPTITSQPQDISFCPSGSASLTVGATGSGLTYLWQKDGVDLSDGPNGDGVTIAGATTATLSLSNVAASYNGAVVSAKVCDANGVVVSRLATLRIGVFFAQAPASTTVCQNTDATFSVLATGKGTLSYVWQKDTAGDGVFGDIVPPATGTSVTLPNVQTADSGTKVRCVVTDECGSVTSSEAVLTVKGNPTGLSVYFPVEVDVGKNAHFYCSAAGTGVLHYQWYKTVRGVKTEIGTDQATVDYTVEQCDNWYENGVLQLAVISCKVTDDCGSAETDSNGTILCTLKVATGAPVPQDSQALCTDGLDNSCNGLIDCDDPLCVSGGFCCGHTPFADADDDGDVDQADFGVWQLCYTGPGDPGQQFNKDLCFCFDRNMDNAVDMNDFNAFEACYSGPSVPASPTCGQQ